MAGFLPIRHAFVLLLGASALAQGDARMRFERIAGGLEHLDPTDYLYDRVPDEIAALAQLPRRKVEPLVGHPDPQVRALALGVLMLRGDPQSLPAMVAVAFDPGAAPPARQPNAVALPRPGFAAGPLWTLRPQTVGQVATAFVQSYLSAAGFHGGIEGQGDRPGFAEYWDERRGRAHCLSWFAVDLRRASQSSWPMAPERRRHVAALRARIDALAEPHRHWILLALCAPWETGMAEPGTDALASEADLVRAAQALGRDPLLGLLRGEQVFPDDPDLRYGDDSPFSCQRVVPFVLRHATELLHPACSAELRALGRRHLAREPVGAAPSLVTARWFTAAADLDPANAVPILRDALDRFGGPRTSTARTTAPGSPPRCGGTPARASSPVCWTGSSARSRSAAPSASAGIASRRSSGRLSSASCSAPSSVTRGSLRSTGSPCAALPKPRTRLPRRP